MFELHDDQHATLTLVGTKSSTGAEVPLPAGSVASFQSSDPSVLALSQLSDTSAGVTASGNTGTVQISVSVTIPGKPSPLTATLDVQVTSSIDGVKIVAGIPEQN